MLRRDCSLTEALTYILPTTFVAPSVYNFTNSLNVVQARHFVGPDLNPNCLTIRVPEIIFRKSLILEQISRRQKACMQRVKMILVR